MDFYRHGFCVEPECGVKFHRVSANQRFCEKHSYQAKYLASWGKQTKCLMCEQPFVVQHGGQLYCQAQCKEAARNLRKKKARQKKEKSMRVRLKCACGSSFTPKVPTQKRCDSCIIRKKVEEIAAAKSPVIKTDDALPCSRCKHSAPNMSATFGVECTINRWLLCKPLNVGAVPYEALDSTA